MRHRDPPPGWPQRVRRGLPFPPGRDGEEFEILVDRYRDTYHLNLATGEVFKQVGERWDQPGWLELPEMVRARVHETRPR